MASKNSNVLRPVSKMTRTDERAYHNRIQAWLRGEGDLPPDMAALMDKAFSNVTPEALAILERIGAGFRGLAACAREQRAAT